MHDNPFYPSFSLRPEQFFGRKEHLESFSRALVNASSPDISFILTGTRGCGKTSLLHQFAMRAKSARMDVIEASSADALARLREYTGMDMDVSTRHSIAPSISIGGLGSATLGEISRTRTSAMGDRIPDALVAKFLCDRLQRQKLKNGLMIFVDESQKLVDGDLSTIGNAVQQAISNGHRVGLVLCGLPQSYHKIRNVRSCTFLHRLKRVNLWCMGVEETLGFLKTMLARVPEMGLGEDQIYSMGSFSGGHPYLMQLLGDSLYRVVDREISPPIGTEVPITREVLGSAEGLALQSYKNNVLDNVLSGTRQATRDYIRAVYRLRDKRGLASTREVAQSLGMSTREANPIRNYALSTQVIQREERGYVSFALPHCKYLFEPFDFYERKPRAERWHY